MSVLKAKGKSDFEPPAWFVTTQWSVVLRARDGDAGKGDEALEKLCRTYWPPIYAYIRREISDPHEAQDLTQEFLSRLVHEEWLTHLQDQRGRFRSFLLAFLKHFLSDQRDRAAAQKRGGNVVFISLDECAREETSVFEPSDGLTPDQVYDQRWARVVMEEAAKRLREEYIQRGRGDWYELFKDLQPGEHGMRSYADLAAQLGTTEQAIKNGVHSFRRRYGELLRDEIAQTVSDPAKVEAEIQHLLGIFAR